MKRSERLRALEGHQTERAARAFVAHATDDHHGLLNTAGEYLCPVCETRCGPWLALCEAVAVPNTPEAGETR